MSHSMFNLAPGSKKQTKQSAAPAAPSNSAKEGAKDNALRPASGEHYSAATAEAHATVRFDDDWSSRHSR